MIKVRCRICKQVFEVEKYTNNKYCPKCLPIATKINDRHKQRHRYDIKIKQDNTIYLTTHLKWTINEDKDKFRCSNCKTNWRIDADNIEEKNGKKYCKKCKTKIQSDKQKRCKNCKASFTTISMLEHDYRHAEVVCKNCGLVVGNGEIYDKHNR